MMIDEALLIWYKSTYHLFSEKNLEVTTTPSTLFRVIIVTNSSQSSGLISYTIHWEEDIAVHFRPKHD
jgi:hypothetical protein